MTAHAWLTQSTVRSRAFEMMPRRPPGRSTLATSANAWSASNQWNAWATVMASSAPVRTGRASAVPAATATPGTADRSSARIPPTGSTASTDAPVGMSSRVSLPVPAARSATTEPDPSRRASTSHARASGG